MAVLILSDIHGNLEALRAVLDAARDVDAVICLGDIVGYGPNPNECVETVRELPNLICLAGNHDLGVAGQIDTSVFSTGALTALLWTREALRPDTMQYLLGLEPTGRAHDLALAHASPRDPVWEYLESTHQAAANFRLFEGQTCVVGHTHVPRAFEQAGAGRVVTGASHHRDVATLRDGARRILNPGGVGQPRDGDPRAAYARLDAQSGTFTFMRVEYPISVTQRKILEAGLPPSLASRLSLGM